VPDILVIGGGVVGLSSALALARRGHRIRVVDGGADRQAASWGNAGHLAVEQVAPLASAATLLSVPKRIFSAGGALALPPAMALHWLPFGLRMLAASRPRRFVAGVHALRSLLHDTIPAWMCLADAIGRPDLVRRDGHIVAWESPVAAAAGRAAWNAAEIGTARIEAVPGEEMALLRALTGGRIADAIRFRGSGQIADLGALAASLEAALVRAGGEIVRTKATLALDKGRARVMGHEADLILVAAGAGSRPLMAGAGHSAPLIAERGYHIRADNARWPAGLPPLVFEDRSMIVTPYADCVQAASFVEFGSLEGAADPRKWRRLEGHVAALGLPIGAPFARWMGARPTLPDYLPAIGRSRRAPNLLYAFGHQHLGLTMAPVTAECVAAIVEGSPPPVDLAPFAIERFEKRSKA
jgi:D-amino-acid dehydrogenase